MLECFLYGQLIKIITENTPVFGNADVDCEGRVRWVWSFNCTQEMLLNAAERLGVLDWQYSSTLQWFKNFLEKCLCC